MPRARESAGLLRKFDRRGRRRSPLYAGQDGGHIIRRTPSVLQNVETKLARAVDVWVEHLADELDAWWPIRVLLLELHHQSEGAVFEGSVCRADDDGVPSRRRGRSSDGLPFKSDQRAQRGKSTTS